MVGKQEAETDGSAVSFSFLFARNPLTKHNDNEEPAADPLKVVGPTSSDKDTAEVWYTTEFTSSHCLHSDNQLDRINFGARVGMRELLFGNDSVSESGELPAPVLLDRPCEPSIVAAGLRARAA